MSGEIDVQAQFQFQYTIQIVEKFTQTNLFSLICLGQNCYLFDMTRQCNFNFFFFFNVSKTICDMKLNMKKPIKNLGNHYI